MARGFARLQVAQYVDCLADSDSDVHLRNGQYSDCGVVDGKRIDTWRGVGFADGGSGCQQRINVGNWQSFRQKDAVAVHPFDCDWRGWFWIGDRLFDAGRMVYGDVVNC